MQTNSQEPKQASRPGHATDEEKRLRHAEAQRRYRERNLADTREKARLRMYRLREAIKSSEERRKLAAERRCAIDADYRERRRQESVEKDEGIISQNTSSSRLRLNSVMVKTLRSASYWQDFHRNRNRTAHARNANPHRESNNFLPSLHDASAVYTFNQLRAAPDVSFVQHDGRRIPSSDTTIFATPLSTATTVPPKTIPQHRKSRTTERVEHIIQARPTSDEVLLARFQESPEERRRRQLQEQLREARRARGRHRERYPSERVETRGHGLPDMQTRPHDPRRPSGHAQIPAAFKLDKTGRTAFKVDETGRAKVDETGRARRLDGVQRARLEPRL
ncbi:hypothetical protein GGX14DRAFT_407561 [Mycena pura]|uniref:Uncharacterized protein n=1 Tax=Mycena pura TaxID=153505 RepID=A0AAD6UN04_9AGAR|nr:hypothetical protein GGX14DRAFT_407561 [Mycena pura]